MATIFLILVVLSALIFFLITNNLFKSLPSKRIKYASRIGYVLQFIGLIGLVFCSTELLTSSLQIAIEANVPDLIRAISELLWPIAAIVGVFWFLPQILEFFRDPEKAIPILNAISGKQAANNQLLLKEDCHVSELPEYANSTLAQKEIIQEIEADLESTPEGERKSRLLMIAANLFLTSMFERVYNLIFGSQIQALLALKNNASLDISSFYDTHKQKAKNTPDADSFDKFDDWVRLLLHFELVIEHSGKFTITNKGTDFIWFLEQRGYSLLKIL